MEIDEDLKMITPKIIDIDAYDEIDGKVKKFSLKMSIINNLTLIIQLNYNALEIPSKAYKVYISRNYFNILKQDNKIFSSCKSLLEIENNITDLVKGKGSTIKIKKVIDNKYTLTIPISSDIQDKLIFIFNLEENPLMMDMNNKNNPMMMGMNNLNYPKKKDMNNMNDSIEMDNEGMNNPILSQ